MKRVRQLMKIMRGLIAVLALAVLAAPARAQEAGSPAPPSNLTAVDHPWDDGASIDLAWSLSPDDARLEFYQVLKAVASIGGKPVTPVFAHVEFVKAGTGAYRVGELAPALDKWDVRKQYRGLLDVDGLTADGGSMYEVGYVFRVVGLSPDKSATAPAETTLPLVPTIEPFDAGRFWLLIIMLTVCGSIVAFIILARRGMPMKVRRIAGLAAVDEAVGRATEMGRPVLFVCGTQDMNDIQTIAGITVLSRVAKTAAEYDAKVEVPTSRALVMTAARETVNAAYLAAGRPDAYNPDLIYYVTEEQFGFVAHLQGTMVRQAPAACFYMGSFFAESLILAETGNSIGAIQIAGTAQPAQLPFFVAACDYTLIGEEFFAASAYLSGEPDQIGSLKGQDVGKALVAAFLIVGCLIATAAAVSGSDIFQRTVEFIRGTMLT